VPTTPPRIDLWAVDLSIKRACPTCGSAKHGRPSVVDAPVEFSVSSSDGLAVVAALAPGRQGPGFLRLWTAKEAVLKASGRSLADDPATIEVADLLEGDAAEVVDGVRTIEAHEDVRRQHTTQSVGHSGGQGPT